MTADLFVYPADVQRVEAYADDGIGTPNITVRLMGEHGTMRARLYLPRATAVQLVHATARACGMAVVQGEHPAVELLAALVRATENALAAGQIEGTVDDRVDLAIALAEATDHLRSVAPSRNGRPVEVVR